MQSLLLHGLSLVGAITAAYTICIYRFASDFITLDWTCIRTSQVLVSGLQPYLGGSGRAILQVSLISFAA